MTTLSKAKELSGGLMKSQSTLPKPRIDLIPFFIHAIVNMQQV